MLSLAFLLQGVAAPLLTSFAVTSLAARVWNGGRGVAAAGFLAGQAIGLALALYGQQEWTPSRNLHWVPWAALWGALLGSATLATGLVPLERWLLAALAALAAAVVIVPDWPDLWPSRAASIAAVTGALTLVARGIDDVARRSPPRLTAFALAITPLAAAILIAINLSLRLGESALTTAAAFLGTAAALLIRPDAHSIRGLALPFALGVGGWCYVSAIELPPPAPPLIGLLFVPLAPLALWPIASGPLSRRSARTRTALGAILLIGSLAGIAAWTVSDTESEPDDDSLTAPGQ